MDIEKIIDDVITTEKTQPKTEKTSNFSSDQKIVNLKNEDLSDLVLKNLNDDDIRLEIYNRFRNDVELLIEEFLSDCKDVNASQGMYKCSLETWQACVYDIGLNYFFKNKYLRDTARNAVGGGIYYNETLLAVGMALYESLCAKYRKQFFIYDCCKFLGMSLDNMYKLNEMHGRFLKMAHSIQESSFRTALASGRSNVTAMAILLNHDYDYTRTTQVIHTSANTEKSADSLPDLRLNDNLLQIDDM